MSESHGFWCGHASAAERQSYAGQLLLKQLALAIPLAYGPPSLMMYFVISAMKGKRRKACWGFICPFCKLHFFCERVKLQRALFIVSQLSVRASRAKRKSEREIERVLGLCKGLFLGN